MLTNPQTNKLTNKQKWLQYLLYFKCKDLTLRPFVNWRWALSSIKALILINPLDSSKLDFYILALYNSSYKSAPTRHKRALVCTHLQSTWGESIRKLRDSIKWRALVVTLLERCADPTTGQGLVVDCSGDFSIIMGSGGQIVHWWSHLLGLALIWKPFWADCVCPHLFCAYHETVELHLYGAKSSVF